MRFITRCFECGDQNQLGDGDMASIQLYFHKGTPNTKDRMVTYCENCGNKHEIGIEWFIDTVGASRASENEQAVEADAESCACRRWEYSIESNFCGNCGRDLRTA